MFKHITLSGLCHLPVACHPQHHTTTHVYHRSDSQAARGFIHPLQDLAEGAGDPFGEGVGRNRGGP